MNKINYLISSFARANLNSHSAKILKGRSVGSETVFAPPSEKHSRSKVAILGRLAPSGKTRPFPSERRKKASHNEIVFHLTLVLCCSEWTKVSFPPHPAMFFSFEVEMNTNPNYSVLSSVRFGSFFGWVLTSGVSRASCVPTTFKFSHSHTHKSWEAGTRHAASWFCVSAFILTSYFAGKFGGGKVDTSRKANNFPPLVWREMRAWLTEVSVREENLNFNC